jgi:hypothetical protein
MSLGIFKKAFSTAQIDNIKSYFSSVFAPLPNYKVYRALMTQVETDAPTATILENTLGNIVWERDVTGIYLGTLTGVFTTSKLFLPNPNASGSFILRNTSFASTGTYSINRKSDNILELRSYRISGGTLSDEMLNNAPIEIIVYN